MILSNIVNTGYEVIFTAFSAIFTAQVLKFIIFLIFKHKLDLRLFTTTGGMPSSHSAGVMGLSTAVGLICGFSSIEFAIAIGYACIVMYDAAGVARKNDAKGVTIHVKTLNNGEKISLKGIK